MYATTEAEFTASGTAGVLVDCYIPLWGCPFALLSDNDRQFCSKLSCTLYERLGINKIPSLRRCRVRQSLDGPHARHDRRRRTIRLDLQLPPVESAYNNSVGAATGLASNEVHMGRLPRLLLAVFDLPNVGGIKSSTGTS